jgi:hypothetical protein
MKITMYYDQFTRETASRAASATISAQETTPGHFASNSALAASMTKNPSKLKLGLASFSATFVEVEFINTDPSQPCLKKKLKELIILAKSVTNDWNLKQCYVPSFAKFI